MGATHGRLAAVYLLRPNGFVGVGLNDVSWGLGYNGVASGLFEVVIDHVLDSFKWRKNGGAWTEDVAITGAAQTLSDAQTITFGATTGHTVGDAWSIGNLAAEACTEVGATAQITDAAKRILNPNATVVFTDTGGKNVTEIRYGDGMAFFDDTVTIVTAEGNDGYSPLTGLQKVGYLFDWSANFTVDVAAIPRAGKAWKEKVAGQGDGSGAASSYFIGTEAFFHNLKDSKGQKYYFLQLFTWDPDQDQTGDHFRVWAILSGVNLTAPVGDVVKEALSFQMHGMPAFVANA